MQRELQDLLNKIPFPKKIRTFKGDKLLRKLKYVIFAVFVILLPMFLVDIMGQGSPYFCKLICPAGTLEGGIPLALLNKSMRSALGALYVWKNAILVVTIILSIIIYRPFCKYMIISEPSTRVRARSRSERHGTSMFQSTCCPV